MWIKKASPARTIMDTTTLNLEPYIRAANTTSPVSVRIQEWALTPIGRSETQELRAILPSATTVHARMLQRFNMRRTPKPAVVRLIQALGVPIRVGSTISSPTIDQSWAPSREKWLEKCSCEHPHLGPGTCAACGLASPIRATPGTAQCY